MANHAPAAGWSGSAKGASRRACGAFFDELGAEQQRRARRRDPRHGAPAIAKPDRNARLKRTLAFDPFHVVQARQRGRDQVRRDQYNQHGSSSTGEGAGYKTSVHGRKQEASDLSVTARSVNAYFPGEQPVISASLWVDWALIARDAAQAAAVLELSDAQIDEMSAAIAGLARPEVETPVEPSPGELGEHRHAMVAVAASAHSIDGFYGSIKPMLDIPPRRGRPPRSRVILEALKLGFAIGRHSIDGAGIWIGSSRHVTMESTMPRSPGGLSSVA